MAKHFMLFVILFVFFACSQDDEMAEPELSAPSIEVIPNDNDPYPGDTVTCNIRVKAVAGIRLIAVDEKILAQFGAGERDEADLSYQIIIPEGASFGNQTFDFIVIDFQAEEKRGAQTLVLDVQNPALRGNPSLVANFNAIPPDPFILSVASELAIANGQAAYQVRPNIVDPKNRNNRVVSILRNPALELDFRGFGTVQVELLDTMSRNEVDALLNGDRVLQMNILRQETSQLVMAHQSPGNPGSTQVDSLDASWTFKDHANQVWNFDRQNLAKGIPILIELGNDSLWQSGERAFFLIGSLTESGNWQTVTFSRAEGSVFEEAGIRRYDNLNALPQSSGNQASVENQSIINANQINQIGIQINNIVTAFNHPDGWLDISSNQPIQIRDDHNTYFIDNIRTIDAEEFDKNPNE